jgi:hypothetical protein
MKKLLLIASAIIILASCKGSNVQTKDTNYKIGALGYTLEVIELEGCEYLYTRIDRGAIMCHKGNCKNPIHYKNK